MRGGNEKEVIHKWIGGLESFASSFTRSLQVENDLGRYLWFIQCLWLWEDFSIVLWLGGVTVRASDLRSRGRGFDSRSGRNQATQVKLSLLSLPDT